MISFHTAIGISVLVFVSLRIVWRWMESQPEPVLGSGLEHKAVHGVHILLYAVIIILPLSGYLEAGGPSQLVRLIEVLRFADTSTFHIVVKGWMGLTWVEFESPIDFIHKQGDAYMVLVLIAAHTDAALYNHLVQKDFVLRRKLLSSVES